MSFNHNPYASKRHANVLVAQEPDYELPGDTIKKITDWVDGDPDKAQFALDEELKRDKIRNTLADDLQEIIDNA